MLDDRPVGAGPGEHRGERFVSGLEPFGQNKGLEQRSREFGHNESRIRFAREEPTAQKRQALDFPRGGRNRAARNLRPFEAGRRDVL